MTTFKGFNTIGQYKKFSITDFELIKRDLLNAFLIREGEMPGRPDIGTTIWAYVFDPNDNLMQNKIANEVRRVVKMDPRLQLDKVTVQAEDNTVIVELQIIVVPNTNPETLYLSFDQDTQTVQVFG